MFLIKSAGVSILLLKLREGFALESVVSIVLSGCTILITIVSRISNGILIIPIENNLGSLANIISSSLSVMPF